MESLDFPGSPDLLHLVSKMRMISMALAQAPALYLSLEVWVGGSQLFDSLIQQILMICWAFKCWE